MRTSADYKTQSMDFKTGIGMGRESKCLFRIFAIILV